MNVPTTTSLQLLDALDPDLRSDFLKTVGLYSSQKAFEAAIPEHGVEAAIVEQLRQVGEARRIAQLALETSGRVEQSFHKALWQLQENITETIHNELRGQFSETGEVPPSHVHVRRAVEETVAAASKATTPDEEELLIEIFLGSLTPAGVRDALGARLRKLVTDGIVGPVEIRELRRLSVLQDEANEQAKGTTVVQAAKVSIVEGGRVDTIFVLAQTRPALVTVMGVGTDGGSAARFLTRIDQQRATGDIQIRVTDSGKTMLRLLKQARGRLQNAAKPTVPR